MTLIVAFTLIPLFNHVYSSALTRGAGPTPSQHGLATAVTVGGLTLVAGAVPFFVIVI